MAHIPKSPSTEQGAKTGQQTGTRYVLWIQHPLDEGTLVKKLRIRIGVV